MDSSRSLAAHDASDARQVAGRSIGIRGPPASCDHGAGPAYDGTTAQVSRQDWSPGVPVRPRGGGSCRGSWKQRTGAPSCHTGEGGRSPRRSNGVDYRSTRRCEDTNRGARLFGSTKKETALSQQGQQRQVRQWRGQGRPSQRVHPPSTAHARGGLTFDREGHVGGDDMRQRLQQGRTGFQFGFAPNMVLRRLPVNACPISGPPSRWQAQR